MSSSQGVVIASNQSPVSVSGTVNAITNNGSVVAFMGGSWSASVQGAFSVIGTVPVTQAGAWTSSVVGQVGASIVGTAPVTQAGTWSVSVMTHVLTSIATAGQVIGSVAALQGTNPWQVRSSLAGGIFPISGSVAAFQATVPYVTNFQNSSILAVPVGSTVVFLQAPSIAGTYSEDASHTTADRGIFVLGVRNDTVASFTSANLEYNAMAHDSAGRFLTKPFAPEEARVEGYNSVVSGSVTTLVAAAGTGLKNYITDIHIANTGAATTLVTFRSGGGSSVLGYTIAPAGGGSNMTFQMPMRTLANETFDFQATTSSSILFATVRGYKAP